MMLFKVKQEKANIAKTLNSFKHEQILFFILSSVLFSCSSKDDKFCHCLELGKKLNNLSTQALQSGVDEKTAAEIKKFALQQKQECKDYTAKNGDDLKKLQEACEN